MDKCNCSGRGGHRQRVYLTAVMMCGAALMASRPARAWHIDVATGTTGCTVQLAVASTNASTPQSLHPQAPCAFVSDSNNANLTINLPSAILDVGFGLSITSNVTINGKGVGVSTLRWTQQSDGTAVEVSDPAASQSVFVTLQNLTVDKTSPSNIVGGISGDDAGVLTLTNVRVAGFTMHGVSSFGTELFITDATIENNTASLIGGDIEGGGGGIHVEDSWIGNYGSLIISNSAVVNNTSPSMGGGIYHAGSSNSRIINTTVSGNSAAGDGGGIFKEPAVQYLFFYSSTVANNSGFNGGGVAIADPSVQQQGIQIFSTIISNNNDVGDGPDVYGQINGIGNSLVGVVGGSTLITLPLDSATIINRPAGFECIPSGSTCNLVLRDVGGPRHLKGHFLAPGSPAIDAIVGNPESGQNLDMDQRHVKRPQLGKSNASKCDMGAVEMTRLETEVLPVAAKSTGTSHVVISNTANYSNRGGTNLQATKVGDFVTYSGLAQVPIATYDVTIGFKKGPNAGTFQVAVGPAPTGTFVNVGGVQDGFGSTSSWVTVDLKNVTTGTLGTKYFRFTVTGKNGASTGYQIFPDFVEFTRQ